MESILDVGFVHDHRAVVHVKTLQEAVELTIAVRDKFPHLISSDRTNRVVEVFKYYKDNTALRFNYYNNPELIDFGYCRVEHYIEQGYRVIEYEDLIPQIDIGEINTGFKSLTDALSVLF